MNTCEWCNTPIKQGAKTCGASHRAKRHRWLHNIPDAQGLPERPPACSVLWAALIDREIRSNGARKKPSGAQVSYYKAVRAAARLVLDVIAEEAISTQVDVNRRAEDYMRAALPQRQRERLEARQ